MKKLMLSSIVSLSLVLVFLLPSYADAAAYQSSSAKEKVIEVGKNYIGTAYRFGGSTPKGFDCSGFIGYTYSRATGKKLPRTTTQLFSQGTGVNKSQLQKGDMVFFSTYKKGPSHVGIYIGNNNFLHASTSRGVTIDSLSNKYWNPKYIGARRI
ncbi:C40 family peptidase [Bacillus testis]|uniref:C40 family peptidase n=1 Tax=Bacillus testis TaxID=1622072 RepID=UPI00067E9BDD|nr:C40 family peptidase [Bacillus testis]